MQAHATKLEADLESEKATVKELKNEVDRCRAAYQKLEQESHELNLHYCRLQQADRQSHIVVNADSKDGSDGFPDPPSLSPQNIDTAKSQAPEVNSFPHPTNKAPEVNNSDTQAIWAQLNHVCQAVLALQGASDTKGQQEAVPHIHTDRSVWVKSPMPSDYVGSDRSVSDPDSDVERRGAYSLPHRDETSRRHYEMSPRKRYDRSPKGDQSSSGIIKFLNATVPKFAKKGSAEIADHLELYQSTMDSLKLYSDADRIRFLPWAFENRYRHYFTSFRERGIRKWQDVLHEVKLEFGPYRTINAAKRDIYKLRCKPDQNPREFLSTLKNAYGLAYRSPNWESGEFKQLFYDAMPVQIKFSLARDLDLDAPLDRLVTAATSLYNISECNATGERRFRRGPEQSVAEARLEHNLGFETQPRRYPQSAKPVNHSQQNQVGSKQAKPRSPNGSEGDNNGHKRYPYRPQYNNRGPPRYRRWDNRPRQQKEGRPEPSTSPRSRSPTDKGMPQNQNRPKSNDRFDKLSDQVAKLTEMVNKMSQVSTENKQKSFLEAAAGPSSAL